MLRNHADGFCCLGVLCDVADPKGWHLRSPLDQWHYEGDKDCPSKELLEQVGLNYIDAWDLATFNDNGATFEEIIPAIRAKAHA